MPKKNPKELTWKVLKPYKGYDITQTRFAFGAIQYTARKSNKIMFQRDTLREIKSSITDYENRKSKKVKTHASTLSKTRIQRVRGSLKYLGSNKRKY
jgi:hypothetical protein